MRTKDPIPVWPIVPVRTEPVAVGAIVGLVFGPHDTVLVRGRRIVVRLQIGAGMIHNWTGFTSSTHAQITLATQQRGGAFAILGGLFEQVTRCRFFPFQSLAFFSSLAFFLQPDPFTLTTGSFLATMLFFHTTTTLLATLLQLSHLLLCGRFRLKKLRFLFRHIVFQSLNFVCQLLLVLTELLVPFALGRHQCQFEVIHE
mmetsp:Transcript_11990/g.20319  ORF Transcript_11990/g.20319 Transcript_11990/m.20319 type:complete len:200 (+) Transcript_11990:96-695(+)